MTLTLPYGGEVYLALQRTDLQHPINRHFRKVGLDQIYDRFLLPYIESRRHDTLQLRYSEAIERDYRTIRSYLPEDARDILDIGAGLAGIDVLLYRHYGGRATLRLLDRQGITRIHYGYKARPAAYNSFEVAQRFLEQNDVASAHIKTYDVDRDGFPEKVRFDVVISLLSWGYHYPLSVYLTQVREVLRLGGTLIVDLRKKREDPAALGRAFGTDLMVIDETSKWMRVAVRKV